MNLHTCVRDGPRRCASQWRQLLSHENEIITRRSALIVFAGAALSGGVRTRSGYRRQSPVSLASKITPLPAPDLQAVRHCRQTKPTPEMTADRLGPEPLTIIGPLR
ncbi:hypothetical protein ELH47_11160 [Rhizobium ruizarguesonis]|nr:hypothetical protein ELH47_11160 [Rhizobium ruizarguesonis]